jgi:transposase
MFKGWFKECVKEGDKKVIKKFYDFFLKKSKRIIEVHGEQHYKEGFQGIGGRTLEEEQENDRLKKNEALKNGIDESSYIVIDAKISTLEYLKNSILNSRIRELFDLSNVDWDKCHEDALKTIVKTACDEWNSGTKNVRKISEKLGLGHSTVLRYLKQGAEIGWCDYDAENEIYSRKAVVQLTIYGEFISEYKSVSEASHEMGVSTTSNISSVCTGKTRTAYGYRWLYKEDYNNLSEEEKFNLRNFEPALNEKKEVFQLDKELNIINTYESLTEASRKTSVSMSMISEVCNGKFNSSRGYKWMFKGDFDNLTEEEREKLCKISVVPITQKKVAYQLDENLNIIYVYESLGEATKQTGISISRISEVCNGRRKSAGGYKWMFKGDYEKSQTHV